jgi:hypothetical protein
MSIEVENSATGFSLGRSLQPSQVLWPETVEEFADGRQSVRAHDEQMAGPLAPFGYQARAA